MDKQKAHLLSKPIFFQPKLTINQPNDIYEQEADAVAESVMRMPVQNNEQPFFQPKPLTVTPVQRKCAACEQEEKLQRKEEDEEESIQLKPLKDFSIQRKCAHCEEEEKLQMKEASTVAGGMTAPSIVNNVINSPGQSLDKGTRNFMESRFGYDFSNVQIHNDSLAHRSSADINALAYTHGNHVVFGAGQYKPNTSIGKRLLAHELTHVLQQDIFATTNKIQRKNGSSPSTKPGTLQFDVLGSDYSVNKSFAQAAKLEPGIDLHITSLDDLISQLAAYTGAGTNSCVSEINFWNHGSPGGQSIAGTEEIETRQGKKYKIPTQRLSLDWLLRENNMPLIKRLRALLCCNARMRWLGCGTTGVTASGGLRGDKEKQDSGGHHYDLRYRQFGDRFQTIDDAIQHGAKIQGAQLGFLNAQNWANATCTEIIANNDFTYMAPGISAPHFRPGFGGEFATFQPDPSHCSCDPNTGRVNGDWTPEEGKKLNIKEQVKVLGPDYLWHQYLKTFRRLEGLYSSITSDPLKDDLKAGMMNDLKSVFRSLLEQLVSKVSVPPGLPVKDMTPWINPRVKTNDWAGVTMPQLVFCYPDNCWLWIALNQHALRTTPAYTKEVIEHELLHAKDIWHAAGEFIKLNGPAPVNPQPDVCNPDSKFSTWGNPFGEYVRNFVKFYYKGRETQQTRHVDIYAETIKNNLAGMSYQEIVAQFGALISEMPPGLPAKNRIIAEDVFEPYFTKPVKDYELLRNKIAEKLVDMTKIFVFDVPADKIKLYRGKAITILNHFKFIWSMPYPKLMRPEFIKALEEDA